jgi:class 3 adenylate cyclase
MSVQLWIAAIGLAITLLGTVVAVTRALVKAPLEASKASLTDQVSRLQHNLDDQRARSDEIRVKSEQDLVDQRSRLDEVRKKHEQDINDQRAKYDQVVQDLAHWKSGKGAAVLIKTDIDSGLHFAMTLIGASASSILVPAPTIQPPSFVFLSVFGPKAPELRNMTIPIQTGLVGKVFSSGETFNTGDPYREKDFFAGVDRRVEGKTDNILTIPLFWGNNVIGVAQFLNKASGDRFSESDLRAAVKQGGVIAERVADFIRDASNFDILPVMLKTHATEATLLFCDLTASHILFEHMDAASAIRLINEYLSGQASVALKRGATIDKYLGDGIMIRFNVPMPIVGGDHVLRALEAAWEMTAAFQGMKQGWLDFGLPVQEIHGRIGVAAGLVFSEVMGHPQFQTITVIGPPVNRAAILCEAGVRDRNVVLIDEQVARRASKDWEVTKASDEVISRLKSPAVAAFEVVSRRNA